MDLLLKDDIEFVYLNDADLGIASFWEAIRTEPERLIDEIMTVEVSVNHWLEVRNRRKELIERFNARDEDDPKYNFELGFLTFYLNRTNISGIIDGGCVGGMQQSGKYRIDCRFSRDGLASKVSRIAKKASSFAVSCMDGVDFLSEKFRVLLKENGYSLSDSLVYIDPPYVKQGKNLYFNSMGETEHRRLAGTLKNWTCENWFLTYDNSPLVKELYRGWDMRLLSVKYSANSRERASELAIFPPTLRALTCESLLERIN